MDNAAGAADARNLYAQNVEMRGVRCKVATDLHARTIAALGLCSVRLTERPANDVAPPRPKKLTFKWIALEAKRFYGDRCMRCDWADDTCDVHHITPRRDGGTDEMHNLAVLCPNCHRMADKGRLSPEQLRALAAARAPTQPTAP